MTNHAHTPFIDSAFERAFSASCAKLGCEQIDLLGVIWSESGGKPAAKNPNGGASGLIQFMPATLKGLGWTKGPQAFRCLSASEQMPYVVAYLQGWKADAGSYDSAGRVYQAIFLPATLKTAHAADDVIAARGGRLGWAFEANAVFDANSDGKITVGELTAAVMRNARGPAWREMLGRLGIEVALLDDTDGDGIPEVDTTEDVQAALNRLGAKLSVDGMAGPMTEAAVRAFQRRAGLHEDGRAGEATREALALAVASVAAEPETSPPPDVAPATEPEEVDEEGVEVRCDPLT